MAQTGKRGFGSMDPERQRRYASMGGKAAHVAGTAHIWTPEQAKEAGRKGGAAMTRKRDARIAAERQEMADDHKENT